MRLIHADLFNSEFQLEKDATVVIEKDRISTIGEDLPILPAEEETMDMTGLTLYPGFIDLHIHGAVNEDVSDASVNGLSKIADYLSSHGVTGFCATTMMIPKEKLSHVFMCCEVFCEQQLDGAKLLGVRMEGPFLSPEKCGVQKTEYAVLPSVQYIRDVMKGIKNVKLSIVDVAPELSGFDLFAAEADKSIILSIAHTAASYEVTRKALSLGVHHATHLFNAMSPLGHHEPGPVGAILENEGVTCELICDGLHVHPALLKTVFKVLGEERAVVVSDAMRAAGMPDGEYDLGGTPVKVINGRTDFGNGRLAGSTTNIHAEFVNLIKMGIPFAIALKACTINPARVLGMDHLTGSLCQGKFADIVAMDKDYNVRKVWVRGNLVFDGCTPACTELRRNEG